MDSFGLKWSRLGSGKIAPSSAGAMMDLGVVVEIEVVTNAVAVVAEEMVIPAAVGVATLVESPLADTEALVTVKQEITRTCRRPAQVPCLLLASNPITLPASTNRYPHLHSTPRTPTMAASRAVSPPLKCHQTTSTTDPRVLGWMTPTTCQPPSQ